MIELKVNAVEERKHMHVVSHGRIEGDGDAVLYEMLNVIQEFDSICDGAILAQALDMWLDGKGVK